MNRKNFVRSLGAIAAAPLLPSFLNGRQLFTRTENEIIKPPRLKKGDTIGLVTPAGGVNQKNLEESIQALEELGLKAYYTDSVLSRYGYLGGTDKERRDELMHMFENDKVDGILAVRGGYGCDRILMDLDYEVIKKNPKAMIGYSDITALHYAIFAQTGLVTFHGPVGISTFNDFSKHYFRKVLMEPEEKLVMTPAEEDRQNEDKAYEIIKIRSGKASGRLVGGNLSIAVNMPGTPYDVSYKDKILFFEEVGEDPYRIDRMFTQLMLSGKLQEAAGIALGVFSNCDIEIRKDRPTTSFTLKEVLYDRLYNLGIPVIYGLSFGHITNKYTLPVGINAELDVMNETLTLLEPAVV